MSRADRKVDTETKRSIVISPSLRVLEFHARELLWSRFGDGRWWSAENEIVDYCASWRKVYQRPLSKGGVIYFMPGWRELRDWQELGDYCRAAARNHQAELVALCGETTP